MLILVGSKNPVKIESVKEAFEKYFSNVDVQGVEVSSGVSDQPVNEDTFRGAKNATNPGVSTKRGRAPLISIFFNASITL